MVTTPATHVLDYASPRRASVGLAIPWLLQATALVFIGAGLGAVVGFVVRPSAIFESNALIQVSAPKSHFTIPAEVERSIAARYVRDRQAVIAILRRPDLADQVLQD